MEIPNRLRSNRTKEKDRPKSSTINEALMRQKAIVQCVRYLDAAKVQNRAIFDGKKSKVNQRKSCHL